MTLYIKNMVCDRCIRVLGESLQEAGYAPERVELGLAVVDLRNPERDVLRIESIAQANGFRLLRQADEILVEQVKHSLIGLIRHMPMPGQTRISQFLTDQLSMPYSKISRMFSESEGQPISRYFIRLRIERVKELIQEGRHNFSEIADMLGYSDINHLSGQFKRETGISLSEYRDKGQNLRQPLDRIL